MILFILVSYVIDFALFIGRKVRIGYALFKAAVARFYFNSGLAQFARLNLIGIGHFIFFANDPFKCIKYAHRLLLVLVFLYVSLYFNPKITWSSPTSVNPLLGVQNAARIQP